MKKQLMQTYSNKIVLVTGGTGSIGSEIVRQLVEFKPQTIRIFARGEEKHYFLQHQLQKLLKCPKIEHIIGDIRDQERLGFAMKDSQIVFHCAGLKHVPFCEYNQVEAIKTNILGSLNVRDLALKHGVEKVIGISTDKAVEPSSFMGITKMTLEKMFTGNESTNSHTKFSIVRFGNVLNSRGSIIPLWTEQINQGGPVTVTDRRMFRYFTTIPQAVSVVLRAAKHCKGGEIFVLNMPKYNIYEMAQKLIKEKSEIGKIKIKITGIRPGEKVDEKLMTSDEESRSIKKKDFTVIFPTLNYKN